MRKKLKANTLERKNPHMELENCCIIKKEK